MVKSLESVRGLCNDSKIRLQTRRAIDDSKSEDDGWRSGEPREMLQDVLTGSSPSLLGSGSRCGFFSRHLFRKQGLVFVQESC